MLAARSLARRTARPLSSKAGGFLASIDQGTSSSRAILYDTNLKPLYSHQVSLETLTPHAGWTQMDPMVILSTVETCAAAVLQVRPSPKWHFFHIRLKKCMFAAKL